MSRKTLLNQLQKKDQSVESQPEVNPYSQDDLHSFLKDKGVNVEQTPDLSGAAAQLNPNNQQLDHKEDLQDVPENPISLVRQHLAQKIKPLAKLPAQPFKPIPVKQPELSPENKQLNMKALKSIMSKYKG
jgi:hypothetical protein